MGGLCAPSHTVRSAIWMSGMGGRGRTQKRRCQRASVYRCPQPHRANERQPRHIHWSISSRQRRVHAYRSPQPNDRCRRQPDSFGCSTSFTFHDTGANLGCQRERAIQPVRHRHLVLTFTTDAERDGGYRCIAGETVHERQASHRDAKTAPHKIFSVIETVIFLC